MSDTRNVSPAAAGRAAAKPDAPSAGLSPRTVELVRKSWAAVMPISDAAASLFYERLFELDPTVRPLFKNDIREQKKKLMQTLAVAVDGLANVDKLVPVLKSLGARHAGYMVQDRHYDLVGDALLWTLREGLGDAFTTEVERAWKDVYALIARVMKQAAAEQGKAEVGVGASAGAASPAFGVNRVAAPTPSAPIPVAQRLPQRGVVVVGARPTDDPFLAPAPDSTHPQARTLVGVAATRPAAAPSSGSGFSAHTIELVQRSWGAVLPIADAAAALFYERLFELDPAVRPMFKPDMREQKKKLMQMLTVAVDGLSNPAKLLPTLQALGARHAGYMVQDRHYDMVGQALLWTLREGLGNSFTPEVEAAWTSVYTVVADTMKKAAAQHEAAGRDSPRDAAPTVTAHFDDAETRVQRMPPMSDLPPPLVDPEATRPARSPISVRQPVAVAAAAAPDEPRTVMLHLDAQSLPPLQVRVTLESPSPYLGRDQAAATDGHAGGNEGLVSGMLLGTLCLVFSMLATGLAALASEKALPAGLLLGLPLAALALVLTAFAFGYLWGKRVRASTQGKS